MRYKFGKTIIIALGGSIVYPDEIDSAFIKKFRVLILKFLKRKRRFVLVVGGGRAARLFQEAAHAVVPVTDEDKDWLGIHATRLNAHLLRTVFRNIADPVVIDSRDKLKKLSAHGGRYPVIIASGWRPGWSTDYISIAIADYLGAKEAVIAGKPAHVYPVRSSRAGGPGGTPRPRSGSATSNGVDDKDLNKENPLHELSWSEYRKLIPEKWKPGLHSPVDPVGARLAQKKKIAAIIINGKDLKNFENLLNGRNFKGTVIR